MTNLFAHRRVRRALTVVTATAILTASCPSVAGATIADTPPPPPPASPVPAGPPAPPSFAGDLMRIFDEATSVPPPPGVASKAPAVSTNTFHQKVAHLTTRELRQMYDANSNAWPQIIATIDTYAQSVAPIAAAAAAAPIAARRPVKPAARQAASAAGAPDPPVIFEPTACPLLAFADVGGAYQEIYAIQVAQGGLNLADELLETAAEGDVGVILLEAVAGEAGITAPIAVATILGTVVSEIGLSVAAVVLGILAATLEIPLDVIHFLLNRSIASCQYDNATAEVPVIDGNAIGAQTNVNASYRVGQQNYQADQAINQLLDARTQTIISQLNNAQTSLDLDLRHNIEEALAGGGNTTIVAYQLPSSLGGYLDATPIGVQAIVTTTLAMMNTAKQPIGHDATDDLLRANHALATGQYKQAFTYYQAAYGQLVR
jgi:hypothetical protein